MRRALGLVMTALIGLTVGGVLAVSAGVPLASHDAATPTYGAVTALASLPPVAEAPLPQPRRRVLLVWTPGGLHPTLPQRVAELPAVDALTTVTAGTVDLKASSRAAGGAIDQFDAGWSVPLDTFGVNPRSYAQLLPSADRQSMLSLVPGTAVLGETSARLRRAKPGDMLTVRGNARFEVAAVLDDTLVGGAELVLTQHDARSLGVDVPRFLLLAYTGNRTSMERAIRRVLPAGVSARVRGPGETPFLRHGDAVLPQSLVKATYGEFAYRSAQGPGRSFDQDPRWVRDNIRSATVPILGRVTCHRALLPLLEGALGELQQEGLGHLVDPGEYAGCWSARRITAGGGISRHAWGAAVDLNANRNPTGLATAQDRRMVEIMERWWFTWGGFWLVPDPMHFEYARPPAP